MVAYSVLIAGMMARFVSGFMVRIENGWSENWPPFTELVARSWERSKLSVEERFGVDQFRSKQIGSVLKTDAVDYSIRANSSSV